MNTDQTRTLRRWHIEAASGGQSLCTELSDLGEPATEPPPDLCCVSQGVPEESTSAVDRELGLRAVCARVFARGDDPMRRADDVMSALLTAVSRRTPIALRSVSDLVPVAYALHRQLLGAHRPFVVCDPRRRDGDGSVRSPPSRGTGAAALAAGAGGSVCVRAKRLPADVDVVMRSLREGSVMMVFVCLHDTDPVRDLLCCPLEVPPLVPQDDLDRLLDDHLAASAARLGVAVPHLSQRARRVVLGPITSLAELEKTALRLVALASAPSVSGAAHRLRMAPVSLVRWLRRRGWDTGLRGEVTPAWRHDR